MKIFGKQGNIAVQKTAGLSPTNLYYAPHFRSKSEEKNASMKIKPLQYQTGLGVGVREHANLINAN